MMWHTCKRMGLKRFQLPRFICDSKVFQNASNPPQDQWEVTRPQKKELPPSGPPTREIGRPHGRNTDSSGDSDHFSPRRYLPSDHRIPMSGYCVEWRRCGARPTGIVAMYAVVVVWRLGSTCRGRLFTCTRWPWLVKSVVVIVFGKQALGMTLAQWTLRCLNKCMRRERVGVFVDVCLTFNISSPLNDTGYSGLLVN